MTGWFKFMKKLKEALNTSALVHNAGDVGDVSIINKSIQAIDVDASVFRRQMGP